MNRILALSYVASGLKHLQMNNNYKVQPVKGPVTYIASLEGDLNQLVLSLENSNYLKVTWHKDHEFKEECYELSQDFNTLACWPKLQFKGPTGRFVFGGNLFDFGDGDIRLANMMVKFYEVCKDQKQCKPVGEDKGDDRIYFIMGNRDILKMRFAVKEPKDESKQAWWKSTNQNFDSDIERRRFQVGMTMGASESMAARRREMELLGLDDNGYVTDEELSDSFYWMTLDKKTGNGAKIDDKAKPMLGLYSEYLDYADLIVKIDDTIYAHGYLTDKNFLQVPKKDEVNTVLKDNVWNKITQITPQDTKIKTLFTKAKSVEAWIQKLRAFDDEMVGQWKTAIKNEEINKYKGLFPGRPLTIYMMEKAVGGKTVVESTMNKAFTFTVDTELNMNQTNLDLLKDAGITRCVGGHRPSGPTAMKYKQGGIEFLNVRTSFDNILKRTADQRVSGRGGWSRLETDGTAKVIGIKPSTKATAAQVFMMLQAKNVYKLSTA